MDVTRSDTVYRFGEFALDLRRGALMAESMVIPLRPKSFALLRLFVENAGRLLDRDTINRVLWGEIAVTDDGITQCVRDIRRALRDPARHVLRTVPRRGFIFDATIRTEIEKAASTPDVVVTTDKPSVAVLPFANLSGQPEQEYFSDGIADDIITSLSHRSSLLVVARNSSFLHRGHAVEVTQVGRQLGVRYVVEGSARREGDRLRVNARLISAETGVHLWSAQYDRTVIEMFAVQDEIAAAVTGAIVPAVAEAEQRRALRGPVEKLGAWEAYQRGLWHLSKFNGANLELAREFFEQAIALDATFPAPYSHLAMTYIEEGYIYVMRPAEEALRLAEAAALKALEHDPTDAEAQASAAFATMVKRSEEGIPERLAHALASNPNSPWVHGMQGAFLVWNGRTSEGRRHLEIALRLIPLP